MNAFYEGAFKFFLTFLAWIFGLFALVCTAGFIYHTVQVMYIITYKPDTKMEVTPIALAYLMGIVIFTLFSGFSHGLRKHADDNDDWFDLS
jgi:hypothetical protein